MAEVTIRSLENGDGPALARLVGASPDTGRIGVSQSYTTDPVKVFQTVHKNNHDFAAVNEKGDIVGTCSLSFDKVQYEGALVNAAYLHSLIVHPEFRRQGIASKMVEHRVDVARKELGQDVFLYALIQSENTGSEKVSSSWNSQIIPEVYHTKTLKSLKKLPVSPDGISVRILSADELKDYAIGSNQFFMNHNCYHPLSPDEMKTTDAMTPVDRPIRYRVAAFSKTGEMLAGILVNEHFRCVLQRIVRIPWALNMAAKLAGEIPRDGVIRITNLLQPWYNPGQEVAAAYIFDWIRHTLSREATTFVHAYTPGGPFANFPKGRKVSNTSIALAGPPWSGARPMA